MPKGPFLCLIKLDIALLNNWNF